MRKRNNSKTLHKSTFQQWALKFPNSGHVLGRRIRQSQTPSLFKSFVAITCLASIRLSIHYVK